MEPSQTISIELRSPGQPGDQRDDRAEVAWAKPPYMQVGDSAACFAALLEQLVAEHMERAAEAIRAEGWKWVEVGLQVHLPCAEQLSLFGAVMRSAA